MKIYFSPSFIQKPINFATYQEKGQEYLLFWMTAGEFLTFENPNCLLLVPNNSTLAQQIKELVDKDETYYHIFATPAENLRFKSNFYKVKNTTFHGLIIKDTNQVGKIVGNESKRARPEPSQITFKAIKWTKEKENKWGSFIGKLEIEPFSLGIENLPPITRLEFMFVTKENPSPGPGDPNVKNLTESELYKSNILPESAGKTFTMKVKKFYFNDSNTLHFSNSDNYVFGSLSEKKNQNGNQEKIPETLPKNDNSDESFASKPNQINHKETWEKPVNWKIILIVSGIIIGLSFLAFIIYVITTKKKK